MKRKIFLLGFVLLAAFSASAQTTFNINDLINVKRVGDPQISPDGKWVAYTVGVVDKDANKTLTQIFVVAPDGTKRKQLTSDKKSSSGPRWSPDSKWIAFNHDGQVWTMQSDGDDKSQVTKLSSGGGGVVWSADGKWIAFGSEVYPDCKTDECNKLEDEKADNSKVKAHVTERLLFKHWDHWTDRKRTHVFVVSAKGGSARDVTPGDADAPPYGADSYANYAFSPDGKSLAYVRNPDKVEAVSTNSDIFFVNLADNSIKNITAAMRGYDASPAFTPDGKYLLFRSQPREAFEADRWRIMRYNIATGETVELTRGFDQQVEEMAVTGDSKLIYFTAAENGKVPVFTVPVEPDFKQRIATHVNRVQDATYASGLTVSADGTTIVYASSSMAQPSEIVALGPRGSITPLTNVNEDAMRAFGLKPAEDIQWSGALAAKVHGWLLKPANFDPAKKYPLIVLIHGGPQGAWSDNWGYRWNPQIYASQGYIVFMPNPRGSTGYGQKFVDDVSKDWGGKAFVDITNGIAEVVKKPFVDKTRIGAAGASYGGYMIDWLLGHNTDPRFKIKAFVSHAGVYNLESMATATEELWFAKWEFDGFPFQNATLYNKWSPNKFANNFATPTLVTCGELDYRVPYDQSLQLYTTLQLKGVDSKLIVFPDEGHWILKPQNSEFWYNNVTDWFKKYLKP